MTISFHLPSLTILFIIIIIYPTTGVQSAGDDDLIEQVCKKTPFYLLCSDALHSDNSTTSSSDIKGLAYKFANIVLSNATETLGYIQGQLKGTKDPKTEKALANCAELYIPVVKYNLPQGIDAFLRGYYGFTRYVLSNAGDQADACGVKFSGSGGGDDVGARSKVVSELCDVGEAIVGLLIKG